MTVRTIIRTVRRTWYYTVLLPVCALFLTGCSLIDEDIDEMALSNKEPLKTEFSMSFSSVNVNRTRMSEDIVQGQTIPVFRGIQNISLISHVTIPDGIDVPPETKEWNLIPLPINEAYPSPDSPTQFYKDIEVPLYTDKFLFYGEAKTKSSTNVSQVNGCLIPDGLSSVSESDSWSKEGVSFTLQPICSNPESDKKANLLAKYLTNIANKMSEKGLVAQYENMIKNKAGSSVSVLTLIRQLYANIVDKNKRNVIEAVITADASAYASVYDGITGNMASINNSGVITFNEALEGYPANIGLPDGAVSMIWETNQFVVSSSSNMGKSGSSFNTAALNAYVYPPSLYYWVESNVCSTSTLMYQYESWLYARQHGYAVNGKQDYDTGWKHFLDMNEYVEGPVGIYSYCVALADSIQYGVGRLDVTIKAKSAALKDALGRQVHFTSTSFPITGIMIGDQRTVKWNFETADPSSSASIIYDTEIGDMVLSTNGTAVNSTLVLESNTLPSNYSELNPEDKKAYSVNIAVEFLNNSGSDFYGISNDSDNPIIPAGTKFYLLGRLEMNDTQAASQDRVFKQGTITRADLVVESFENAYNVVPDLRNPRLVLGLSADLFWQKGLKLSITEL